MWCNSCFQKFSLKFYCLGGPWPRDSTGEKNLSKNCPDLYKICETYRTYLEINIAQMYFMLLNWKAKAILKPLLLYTSYVNKSSTFASFLNLIRSLTHFWIVFWPINNQESRFSQQLSIANYTLVAENNHSLWIIQSLRMARKLGSLAK